MKKLVKQELKKNNTHISAYKCSFKELFSTELKMFPSQSQRTPDKKKMIPKMKSEGQKRRVYVKLKMRLMYKEQWRAEVCRSQKARHTH